MTLRLLWRAYEDVHKLSWAEMTESDMYAAWLKFCKGLNEHILPEYLPKDADGVTMTVPSSSPMVQASRIPRKVEDSRVLKPFQLRGLKLRNRIIRAAAFDGEQEEDCIATHVGMAKGGVGMTTVAYCCVSPNGKTFDGQLVMEDTRKEFLTRLAGQVHLHGAAISAQLTHGGSFSDRESIGWEQQQAPSKVFNFAGFDFPRTMTLEDCDVMADNFARAAKLAQECGFDCVEIHVGHGYLLSQFLSPKMNTRSDVYGGDAQRRAEFPAECVRRCRRAVGEDFPIIVKMNAHDGMWFGLELADATIAADVLADASADAIIVTCGSVSRNGFYMLRGNTPQAKLVQALPHDLKKLAMMVFGPLAVPEVPYEDCFLRQSARHILKAVSHKTAVVLMGGVNSFSEMEGAMEEGFELVQIARGLIREPDLINRITATLLLQEHGILIPDRAISDSQDGSSNGHDEVSDPRSSCIRCNMCVIATVDPSASFGCPFQKMDAKRRSDRGLPEILSVSDYVRDLTMNNPNNIAQEKRESALQDIEDLIQISSRRQASM